MRDYYQVLGVSPNAGGDEIRRAYRRLARRYHPDISGDDRGTFQRISEAYEILRHQRRRRDYDATLVAESPRVAEGVRAMTPRVSDERVDYFADEVAIDFPSIGSVLDRMRDAFFGYDHHEALSAELLLTAHEAFHGALVPLEVPLRRTCGPCGGRGEIWTDPCAACAGSGESVLYHPVRISVPAGVRHGARFRLSISPSFAPATFVDVHIAIR